MRTHLCLLIRRRLADQGYEVLEATDGRQVVAHTPDLVLLDMMLSNRDGLEICQQQREFSAVPIFFLTVCRQDDDAVRAQIWEPMTALPSRLP